MLLTFQLPEGLCEELQAQSANVWKADDMPKVVKHKAARHCRLVRMKRTTIAAAFAAVATSAFAHSALDSTSPTDGAALTAVPTELTMMFNNDIRLTRVTWALADARSDQLDLDGQTSFATEFVFPFEGMGAGPYLIEWRGLGDDGHPLKGSFSFVVE